MNTQNYLAASDLAYKNLKEETFVDGTDGIRYKVVKALHTQSGYDGYILYRPDTNELVVAHRGTWPEKGQRTADLLTDLGMAVNQANSQYPDAKRLTEMAIKYSQEDIRYRGAAVRQTGHSLGGTLAQLCGYNYGQQTETFNAYGAAALSDKLDGRQGNAALITNHVRGTDPVSAASPHLGRVEHYLNRTEQGLLYGGGYGGGVNRVRPNFPWQVAVAGAVADHGLDNFRNGGLSARDRQFAAENRELVGEFRTEFEKEAREAGGNIRYIREKIRDAVDWGRGIQNVSDASGFPERELARVIAHAATEGRIAAEGRNNTDSFAAFSPSAIQTAVAAPSKYDEVRAMLQGLLNDTDGSYALKVIEKHPERSARFDELVRQSQEGQSMRHELAAGEVRGVQHEQEVFSRSFG